MPAPESFCQ